MTLSPSLQRGLIECLQRSVSRELPTSCIFGGPRLVRCPTGTSPPVPLRVEVGLGVKEHCSTARMQPAEPRPRSRKAACQIPDAELDPLPRFAGVPWGTGRNSSTRSSPLHSALVRQTRPNQLSSLPLSVSLSLPAFVHSVAETQMQRGAAYLGIAGNILTPVTGTMDNELSILRRSTLVPSIGGDLCAD